MIPTSIDGTDITGATIDGQDVQEITVDGQTVFSAAGTSEADNKLIHRWKLDDVNGTVTDSVGSADGTNNGVTAVNGTYIGGGAGEGDGSSDFIQTTTLGNFGSNADNDFAMAFSVDDHTAGGLQAVMGANNDGSFGDMSVVAQVGRDTAGDIELFLNDDSDNNLLVNTSSGHVADGNEHRVVINKKGNSASDIEIYVDQTQRSLTTNIDDGFTNAVNFTVDFTLFCRNSGGTKQKFFDGVLDDLCIFDDSLTQSEIQSYENPWDP
jgi:hypothetical protein